MRFRRAAPGQAIVEFGLIALLFVAILFAIIDFGLLLNTWLSVSSASREIARTAAVGKTQRFLMAQSNAFNLPAVSVGSFASRCCGAASAVEVDIDYLPPSCYTGGSCTPYPRSVIDTGHPFGTVDVGGGCTSNCGPRPDDLVKVTVVAHGATVITPLIRLVFRCTDGGASDCFVPISSTTIMRYEGQEF